MQDQITLETGTAENDPFANLAFPNLLTRVKALLIDLIVILIIFSLSSIIIDNFGDAPNWVRGFIFVFSLYLYEPIFISLFGGTIGHSFLHINVRKFSNPKKKINILQASLRFLMKYMLGWISFLTITGSKQKRAIHDMTSGSIVLFK